MRISNSLKLTRVAEIIVEILDDQFRYLSEGRDMDSDRVLRIHPRMHFDSSIRPSAKSFFNEMISFLGMGSRGSPALAIECRARGMA